MLSIKRSFVAINISCSLLNVISRVAVYDILYPISFQLVPSPIEPNMPSVTIVYSIAPSSSGHFQVTGLGKAPFPDDHERSFRPSPDNSLSTKADTASSFESSFDSDTVTALESSYTNQSSSSFSNSSHSIVSDELGITFDGSQESSSEASVDSSKCCSSESAFSESVPTILGEYRRSDEKSYDCDLCNLHYSEDDYHGHLTGCVTAECCQRKNWFHDALERSYLQSLGLEADDPKGQSYLSQGEYHWTEEKQRQCDLCHLWYMTKHFEAHRELNCKPASEELRNEWIDAARKRWNSKNEVVVETRPETPVEQKYLTYTQLHSNSIKCRSKRKLSMAKAGRLFRRIFVKKASYNL